MLGAALLAGGDGIFIYTIWHGILHITDSLVQIVVPGEAQLSLKHGQSNTIFLESESVVNGKIYSLNDVVNGLECKVKAVSSEEAIPIRRSSLSTTYHVGGRLGHSVLEFTVPQDGSYQLACNYGDSKHGPEAVVAVGSRVGAGIMRTVFTSLLGFFGGLGSGFLILIVTLVLRRRAKTRSATPNAAPR